MAAFKAAMDAGADFIELDVQRTKDRQVVVLHDADFMRMGGDPRRMADLTAAEVATIDIGSKRGPQFAGQHAPTLEEVIDLVRGRTKINIELKYNVPDPGLAPAVVELLVREDFIDQVVITSLDYAALKQVRSIEPRLEDWAHRDRCRRRRVAHRGRLPEPQLGEGHEFAGTSSTGGRQGRRCMDGQRSRGDAAHDRARGRQHHHG